MKQQLVLLQSTLLSILLNSQWTSSLSSNFCSSGLAFLSASSQRCFLTTSLTCALSSSLWPTSTPHTQHINHRSSTCSAHGRKKGRIKYGYNRLGKWKSTQLWMAKASSSGSTKAVHVAKDNSKKPKRSAFGKAAIGLKKNEIDSDLDVVQTSSKLKKKKSKATKSKPKKRRSKPSKKSTKNVNKLSSSTCSSSINPSPPSLPSPSVTTVLQQRDEALMAFRNYTTLPLKTCLEILNNHPALYTTLQPPNNNKNNNDNDNDDNSSSTLSNKLSYLLHEINIKPKQLRHMLETHPGLMETVLLDKEENIASTVEVLRVELDLDVDELEEVLAKKSFHPAILTYPRSELRRRILVYKLDLGYPKQEIRKMIFRDPRMLQTNSTNTRKILKVLNEELDITKLDVHRMLNKEILLLTYKAEDNIRKTIRFLKESQVGTSLGLVTRKGVSTLSASTPQEQNEIIQTRLKDLIMGHPKILSSSIDTMSNKISFFINDVGLTEYELGRVIYRRGGSLLEANIERTLKRKVEYLRQQLDLELLPSGLEQGGGNDVSCQDDDYNGDEDNGRDIQIPVPSASDKTPLSTFERKRLLAQMIATNPDILTLSVENNLDPKFDYFRSVIGLNQRQLRYVLLKRPQLLSLSLERNILPKIKCFTDPRSINSIRSRNEGGDTTTSTAIISGEGDGEEIGLGMTMNEAQEFITEHPQTLTFVLDKIKKRVADVVKYDLKVGADAPLNFIACSENKWKTFLKEIQ